jgi:hypothetical protein
MTVDAESQLDTLAPICPSGRRLANSAASQEEESDKPVV